MEDLDIEIPLVTDAVETVAELEGLTFDEVKQYLTQHFQRLPIGQKREGPVEYKERHLFTHEIVAHMQLDAGLLTNAWSAAGYFAQMLGRACRLSNPHKALTPLIEDFLSKVLFERELSDLYADLKKVNTFRNTRVAHVKVRLNNPEEAWEAMIVWLRCLNTMVDMVY